MKIESIGHAVPKTRLTNDDILAVFRERSKAAFADAEWSAIERRLNMFMELAGTETRHIATNGEGALDLAASAARIALDRAGLTADDIDLVVYASIARGWLEPCMAVAVQEKIGATNATCFDVLDACASWLRALHVVHGLVRSGAYRRVLIVSLESGMADFVRFTLPNSDVLKRYGAAVTLGEAATATVVSNIAEDDDFYFTFKTFSQGYDLCMLPLDNFEKYAPELKSDCLEPNRFMVESTKLIGDTVKHIVDVYQNDDRLNHGRYDICFTHAASLRATNVVFSAIGFPDALGYPTHHQYGNTAAASVPLAMSLAHDDDRLRRGHKVLIIVGSAGITVGFATFTF